ncbi:MAG: carbamoyltransferase HypF [Planctomycetota bacterium]
MPVYLGKRLTLHLKGVVQGVGFRPTLYQWVQHFAFRGSLQNRGDGVLLILEGEEEKLKQFSLHLEHYIPEKAKITQKQEEWSESGNLEGFVILESETGSTREISIPPDLATCPECQKEFWNPQDRRYLYPFNACIHCGPRYTVVNDIPYDREQTTLKDFPLCSSCLQEYRDVRNRRFHAESMACSQCGPKLNLCDKAGTPVIFSTIQALSQEIHRRLCNGDIIAVRGLGGYLLTCDATNIEAIQKLRQRKHRQHQPFAVMARDKETLKNICTLDSEAEKLLTSDIAPITILEPRSTEILPLKEIAPDLTTLGVMLPSTLIHLLLFGIEVSKPFDFLIMTSGNLHGEPICRTNEEAFQRLGDIADSFLTHNRELIRTCDDSLFSKNTQGFQVWRRARGLTPEKMRVSEPFPLVVLALGAEMKNTICLGYDQTLILSPHLGDLFHFEAFQSFQKLTEEFPRFMQHPPEVLVVDEHHAYQTTQWGKKLATQFNIPLIEVQHHHAHAVASMFEHHLSQSLCLVFDGNGAGTDQTLWGGELFHIDGANVKHLATFVPAPLPGGERAIQEPYRQAFARLPKLYRNSHFLERLNISSQEANLLHQMIDRKLNTFQTRAVGRLFDSVAALLGIAPRIITYEAQAAIRLEMLAQSYVLENVPKPYPYEIRSQSERMEVDPSPLFEAIWEEILSNQEKAKIAWNFHYTLACIASDLIQTASSQTQLKTVTLSGGVFQNRLLTLLIEQKLKQNGFQTFLPKAIPAHDGGISLGQALIAQQRLKQGAYART